ncbi:hypothetical protein P9272_32830 [Mesorhizobium sp. WSM4976]|uniref:hypothetical protein n=1 Tax=Mesorhizobium sp. WSM4976 TaxID=3038549 RepID=UPI00241694DE|nr:hypothetical protein [Mesorhizobium sp. WSM4976]MDG4898320.1 hypothetical protein [Mesorhizobium sp. WSM4976]
MELEAVLADAATHIHVLRVDGEARGFCAFNGVGKAAIELVHFGLVPAFQGKRLGPFMLDRVARRGRIGRKGFGFTPMVMINRPLNRSMNAPDSGLMRGGW